MRVPFISALIKPASGLCNLNCAYCFYRDEVNKRSFGVHGIMTAETQEMVVKKLLSFPSRGISIAFQGGEPTLAGLEYFERQKELEKKYNVRHLEISHAIQTNGLLLDEAWVDFLKKERYLVGISLDGNKEIHDRYRKDLHGEGTYNRVMHTIQLLKKEGVDFNILSVLTEQGARAITSLYNFFDRNGLDFQQYIACLDPLGEKRGCAPYSLSCDGFLYYLKTAFDLWYRDILAGKVKYHRFFFNELRILLGEVPEACELNGSCGIQYVVEADGAVFPCDFYVTDEWKLGNLNTDTVEDINRKREELRFVELSEIALKDCLSCEWYGLCRGGCRRDREEAFGEELSKNYFCEAYSAFFEYAYPRLRELSYKVRTGELDLTIG